MKKIQTSICDYFAKFGEPAFRKLEHETVDEFSRKSGLVIATGGGCVTQPENYFHLHQNSKIIWIQRKILILSHINRNTVKLS